MFYEQQVLIIALFFAAISTCPTNSLFGSAHYNPSSPCQDGVIEHKRIFLEEKYVRVEVTLPPFELLGRISSPRLSLA
jgi:hypothetical protein